jgi:hypothetical protein
MTSRCDVVSARFPSDREVFYMIHAMVRNGLIQPLEPLPPEWKDGHEVVVQDPEAPSAKGADDLESWFEDMRKLTADLDNPVEWQQIEAVLAEADRQNKALVRREMGLP